MFDDTDRSRVWWWGFAAVLAVALGFVAYRFVGTLVLGVFLYYAARPVHGRLQRRVGSPTLSATVALLVLVLPAVLLFGYTAALALGELQTFLGSDPSGIESVLEPYLDIAGASSDVQEMLTTLVADPDQLLQEDRVRQIGSMVAVSVMQSLGVVLTGLVHLFVALALAFYLLRDGERLARWTRRTLGDDTLRTYGRAVDADLQTVFFGNILNALLAGVIAAVVFSLLAAIAPPSVPVPVPFLLGLLAGAASLVPVVGMKIVYGPVAVVLTVQALLTDPASLWFPVVFAVVTVVVVDTIPDIVIRPYVSGRNLHVGAVMFAYIFGPLLFGWYGLFLGPLILVLVADFARVVLPELVAAERSSHQVSLTGKPLTGPPGGPPPDDRPAGDPPYGPGSSGQVGDGGTVVSAGEESDAGHSDEPPAEETDDGDHRGDAPDRLGPDDPDSRDDRSEGSPPEGHSPRDDDEENGGS